jgi:hypothetical protein
MWKGIVIKESLSDPKVLWETQELNERVENKNKWHLQTVYCEKESIEKIRKELKPGFFAHFWNEKTIIVAFPDQLFEFEKNDLEARKKAIEHAKQKGIPTEQLDFATD